MMKQQLPNPRRRGIETLIHIIVWGIVIGFPFLMMTRSGFNISLADYLRHGSSSTRKNRTVNTCSIYSNMYLNDRY